MKKWTESDLKFLVDNYCKNGISYCMEKLDRTYLSIFRKSKKMNLYTRNHKKWNDYEIDFLKNNYPLNGTVYCCKMLRRSKWSLTRKIAELKLTLVDNYRYVKENLSNIVIKSKSYSECARNLNLSNSCGNRNTIKKYIKKYNLDISHFDYGLSTKKNGNKKSLKLDEILIENSTYTGTTNLKYRLYREGYKKRLCEKCGSGEIWNGERISLILDHINGINDDNRLNNLRILCPNCNATLETHCRGNRKEKLIRNKQKTKNYKKTELKDNCVCGNKKEIRASLCSDCYHLSTRKKTRPTLNVLLQETKELGFCAVGRKYEVSDNSIRKWINSYKKEKEQ